MVIATQNVGSAVSVGSRQPPKARGEGKSTEAVLNSKHKGQSEFVFSGGIGSASKKEKREDVKRSGNRISDSVYSELTEIQEHYQTSVHESSLSNNPELQDKFNKQYKDH